MVKTHSLVKEFNGPWPKRTVLSTSENPLICNDSVSERSPQVRFSSADVFGFFPCVFCLLRTMPFEQGFCVQLPLTIYLHPVLQGLA